MGENRFYLENQEKTFNDVSGDARFLYANNQILVPTEPSGSRLLYVTTSRDENDWNSLMHNHHFLELFYVLSGNGTFYIGNQVFPVHISDLVIINPYVEHTEHSGSTPMEYIVLGVEGLKFSFDDSDKPYCILDCTHMRSDIQTLFGMMVKEMHETQPYKATVCQNILSVLLVQIMRNTSLATAVVPSKKVNSVIDSVRQYIDLNFKLPLTLDLLSERCHLSKYYLVHHFTDEFGVSPINYLLDRRIEEAQHLLKTTDHSLASIAQMAGFSSASYFSQSFRKAVGASPQDYRRLRQAVPQTESPSGSI